MSSKEGKWTSHAISNDIATLLIELGSKFVRDHDTKLNDLPCIDSFAMLSLAIKIEQHFSISFTGEDLQSFGDLTCNKLIELICTKLGMK